MPVWLVHKTRGITSFDAMKAAAPPGKACHGGALDPFATGLLPLLVGPQVHLFRALHQLPKTYVATLHWGEETDNLDPWGRVTQRGDPSLATAERREAALRRHTGFREQVPPAYSNKRVGGERAFRLAREGRAFELPPQRVYLHAARWLDDGRLELQCRGGYYVRALARDLGRELGCYARLEALHRAQIGPWRCPDALEKLDDEAAVAWLPTRALSDDELGRLRKKQPLGDGEVVTARWALPPGFPPLTFVRLTHRGRTVAITERADGQR